MKNDKTKEHKETEIIINGRQKTVSEKQLSFTDIIQLAFDIPPHGENTEFTVTYRKRRGEEKSLVEGDTVKIKKGMIFNVTATDKS